MKLVVSGACSQGKSTLVRDFLNQWPMYKEGNLNYRKLLKEGGVSHSSMGTKESQKIIMDSIIDDLISYQKEENVIYDRGLFDNLAYTMYQSLNPESDIDDDFVKSCIPVVREALSFYDIIFFVPILEKYPVELVEDTEGVRDMDNDFRTGSDYIMKEMVKAYSDVSRNNPFFPKTNCPAIIEIFGSREERIEMIKLYIKEDGKAFGEEESLMKDMPDLRDSQGNSLNGKKSGGLWLPK